MANLDDLNATLQDVVRAVNNLNETLVAGLPVTTLAALAGANIPPSDITVPRGLLELCLGIVDEVRNTEAGSGIYRADVLLASDQLKAALGE